MNSINIIIFFFCFQITAFSQLVLKDNLEEHYISEVGILNAYQSKIPDSVITSGKLDQRFIPYTIKNQVIHRSAYWLRFTILNNASHDKEWLVEFFDFSINRLAFYSKGSSNNYKQMEGGNQLPFSYKD